METEKQAQIERLSQIAERLATKMHGPALDEWSELELTMPQLRAIGYLGQGSRRMSDLAAYLGISVSSATSLIERLEGKGLVARVHDPVDRRVVMCHLAPLGEAELARFWRVRRTHLEGLADILTSDELNRVVEVMELMLAAFERHHRNQNSAGTDRLAPALAAQ